MIWLQFVFYCVAVPLPRMNPFGVTSVLSSWRERGRLRHSKACMVTKVLAGITYPMSGNFLVVVSTLKTGSSSNIAVRRAKVAKQLRSTEYHMASRNRWDWHQRPLRRQLFVLSSLSPLSKLPPNPTLCPQTGAYGGAAVVLASLRFFRLCRTTRLPPLPPPPMSMTLNMLLYRTPPLFVAQTLSTRCYGS